MSNSIIEAIQRLGLAIPQGRSTPSANFLPVKQVGNLLYVSGQVPVFDGKDLFVGKVGTEVSIEEGQQAAQLCAINMLLHLSNFLNDDLSRIKNCVRLGGFVNASSDFTQHPKVINGASDLMVAVLGDIGKHTRAAIGCQSLPRNVAVELDGIFEIH